MSSDSILDMYCNPAVLAAYRTTEKACKQTDKSGEIKTNGLTTFQQH